MCYVCNQNILHEGNVVLLIYLFVSAVIWDYGRTVDLIYRSLLFVNIVLFIYSFISVISLLNTSSHSVKASLSSVEENFSGKFTS